MMQMFSLVWTLIFYLSTLLTPLELSLAQTPSGRALLASVHNVSPGVNGLRAFLEQDDGSWDEEFVDDGAVFSVSAPVILAGYAYLAAVCAFQVCIYRRLLSSPTGTWESKQLQGLNNISAVTLALTAGGLLALTVQTLANEWFYLTAAHTVTIAALAFVSSFGFSGILNPFDGGERANQAQSSNGDHCHVTRLIAVAVLAALCIVGGVAQTVSLEAMAAPSPGDLDIETAALYFAGFFYFMYVLPTGVVRLARVTEGTLAVSVLTLGTIALVAGIVPAVAMQVLQGKTLVAGWAGAVFAVSLLTFTAAVLSSFPLAIAGPIAFLALTQVSMLACGGGSIACTIGSPPVPAAGALPSTALVVALLVSALWALRRQHGTLSGRGSGGGGLAPS